MDESDSRPDVKQVAKRKSALSIAAARARATTGAGVLPPPPLAIFRGGAAGGTCIARRPGAERAMRASRGEGRAQREIVGHTSYIYDT
eukprot:scaffold7594_cov111-Isochrysis_galbana.AAC.3